MKQKRLLKKQRLKCRKTLAGSGDGRCCWEKLLFVAVSILILSGCGKQESAFQFPPRPIAWASAELHSDEIYRVLTGVTQPVRRAPLSFEVSGVVESVWVEVGQHVSGGQLLASLNTETMTLELQQSRSAFDEVAVEFKQAKVDLIRQKELRARQLNSIYQLDMAQLHHDRLASRVGLLKAGVEKAEKDLRDTQIQAPFGGVINERLIEPGQQIKIGQKVFRIEDDVEYEVAVMIPEGLLNRLQVGSKHQLKIPAASHAWMDAVVTEVSTLPSHTNAYPTTLKLVNVDSSVKGGMTAEVKLSLRETDSTGFRYINRVSIPISSLLMDTDNRITVYRYDSEKSTLSAVPITIGEFIADRVEVSHGLFPGDIVASKGINHLRDGQSVSLMGIGITRYNP